MWCSPLRQALASAGARFSTDSAREFVERFGDDVGAEYRAVREAAGLLDLSYRRKVVVAGSDRTAFLQGMLSNDVASLQPGQGCRAAFLTVQGRLVADLRLYARADTFLLDADPEAAAGLVPGLEKHLIADDVEMTDVTAETVTLSIQGPKADQVMRAVSDALPAMSRQFDHADITVTGEVVTVARVHDAAAFGYELFVPVTAGPEVWRAVLERGAPHGLRPVGRAAFEILRVEAGIPWYGVDMDASRLVLEVGLEDAVSTTKGCYLGQEVVERTSARGHVNRKLTGLRLAEGAVPARGAAIHVDGKDVGVVTSAVDSPALGRPIALGYVRREHLTPGTRVMVSVTGGEVVAEVTALPFHGR